MVFTMTPNTLIRISLTVLAMATLIGCGDNPGPASAPTQTQPSAPQQEVLPRVIFAQTSPDEDIRGVTYLGPVAGMENMGRISDANEDRFAYYQADRPELSSGRYSFSASTAQSPDKSEQSLFRIRPVISSSFGQIDILLSSNGTALRKSGVADNLIVTKSEQSGIDTITFEFDVTEAQTGEYRIMIYPAAALNSLYSKAATGELSVGEVSLTKVK